MSNTISLPFEYTNKSISEWLSQLKSSDVLSMSSEVYKVLSTLEKEHKKIDPVALTIVVMRLTPVVMYSSGSLQKAIIKHSQARKVAQLSIRILYHLVFLHTLLAKKIDLKRDQVLHINYAMQIAGVVFQHCALSYERPSAVLWECLSECYELAFNEDLLDLPVKNSLAEFKALPTISLALKRMLLFCLANPYRCSQKDILSLFDFCTQNSSLVKFVERGMLINHVFCWDYCANGSYQPVYTRPEKLPDYCVLFDTRDLIRSENKRSLNIDNADLLIATFDQYRFLLESTKFALSKSFVFASGFVQVVDFFATHTRQQQILVINTPTPKDLNFSTLELVKEKQKKAFVAEKVASEDIWNYKKEEKEVVKLKFGAMKLVQTPLSLFFVAETMEVKLVSGDLFICYDYSLKPVLGLTRCVELKQRGTIQKSVVELCRGRVTLLQQTQSATKISAILLENEAQHELFLASGKYTIGSVLKFDQVEVVLERLLELSPKFMRYVVTVK